jgi:hypothetical protein
MTYSLICSDVEGGLEMDMVEEGIVYFHHTQGYQRLYIGFYENPLYNISIKTLI